MRSLPISTSLPSRYTPVRNNGNSRSYKWIKSAREFANGALAKISLPMSEVGANGVPTLHWSNLFSLPDSEDFLEPRTSAGYNFHEAAFGSLPLILLRRRQQGSRRVFLPFTAIFHRRSADADFFTSFLHLPRAGASFLAKNAVRNVVKAISLKFASSERRSFVCKLLTNYCGQVTRFNQLFIDV